MHKVDYADDYADDAVLFFFDVLADGVCLSLGGRRFSVPADF